MSKKNKYQIWQEKRKRSKYHIVQKNISNLPRLVVFRSNSNIYAQLIDDEKQTTLLSSSSIDINLKKSVEKASSKIEISKIVGESLAEKINDAKIDKIIFDRNGYKYHGRVKALAEAVRSAEITI
jgi:large subunit ribosomal protein L18